MRFRTMALVAALVASPALALAVTIDFDTFADRQNIHGVNLGGVTFFGTNGVVEVFANGRLGAGFRSAPNSIASLDGVLNNNPLTAIFDVAATFVSFWAGDAGGDSDQWELLAYDAAVGGNLVGSVVSPVWNGNPYMQLSISAPKILRIEANWLGPAVGITYDDLEFTPVPEPGTLFLLGLGLLGAGYVRRDRRS